MIEPCYKNQFVASVKRTDPGDGRDLVLGEIRKIHGAGPSTPGDLRKRARATLDLDSQLRKISQSNADRAARSNDDAALAAVAKALRRPSGVGPFLPEPSVRKGRNIGRVTISDADLTWMSGCRNLRKGSPALNAVGTLPGQDSDLDSTADPGRAGATASIAGYQSDGWRSVTPTRGAPNTAAINSRDALPEDSDAEKRKPRGEDHARRALRRDSIEAPLDSPQRAPSDEATKSIRAIHRAGSVPLFSR
jgi:hypothetical protein